MNKIMNIKTVYFLTFILFFMPCFVIFIKGGTNGNIPVSLIFCLLAYIWCLIAKKELIIKSIAKLIRMPLFKYYLIYVIYVSLTTIVHIILGRYVAPTSFYAVRMYLYYYAVIPVFLFPVFALTINIKSKTIIKLLYSIIYGILIIALIQYLSYILHLDFMKYIFDFFTNSRTALYYGNVDGCRETYRVYALFGEPSTLGNFIFVIMPFVVNLFFSKIKLYNNNIINNIVKKTFLPLIIAIIIFTKSPIYLILCFGELSLLLTIKNINRIKQYFSIVCFSVVILVSLISFLIISNQDRLEETYIYRITNTIESLGDFDKLARKEQSLATRIYSYAIQFVAFKKHPVFGCGLYNADTEVNSYYLTESPLTVPMWSYVFSYSISPVIAGVNRSVVWTTLAEFGIIGFILYWLIMIKCLYLSYKMRFLVKGIELVGIVSINQSLIALSFISFYNMSYTSLTLWLIFGLVLMYNFDLKYNRFILKQYKPVTKLSENKQEEV